VELLIAVFIIIIGFFGIELIDGVASIFSIDGDDEEWLAPMAMIMFIIFIIGLWFYS
tara:strand:- start:213 stop:383 length:171 start_codon:yes stop_codon:yes gene_type:complete